MANEELIAALEAADGPDANLMDDAWFACCGNPSGDPVAWPNYARFRKMILAEAWESAALMLVPEGCSVDLSINDDNFSEVALITAHGPICATGSTPALAICIAALKAGGKG